MKNSNDPCTEHRLRNCETCAPAMSEAADSLDTLVQAASVPNLADLFRKAKQTGVIGPVSVYGESA